jgi:hypothetical protein
MFKRTSPKKSPKNFSPKISKKSAPKVSRKPSNDQRLYAATRLAPSFHAAQLKNRIVNGNDGRRWKSLPDKNKVYHWKRWD